MAKSIVAFFSVSGITKTLAQKIAEKSNSDIFEISASVPYTEADVNWRNPLSRCNREKIGRKDIETSGAIENLSEYETVYLGFPIWYYTAPNIIMSFVKKHSFNGQKIVLFATSGGSGFGKAARTLQNLVGEKASVKEGLLINDCSDSSIEKLLSI